MKTLLRLAAILIPLAALPLAGCGSGDGSGSLSRPVLSVDGETPETRGRGPLVGLPATFTGVLPCADCPGIDYHLNLFADQTYFMRTSYKEPGAPTRDQIGHWEIGSDDKTLILTGDHGSPQYFSFVDRAILRKLNSNARPINSVLPYDLTRALSFRSLEVHTTLRGTYVAMMETGMFTECSTQRRWLVAREGGSTELAAIYHERKLGAGAGMVVTVNGQIAKRPGQTGAGSVDVLVVDHVVGAAPGAACPPSRDTAPLEGTRWRLTSVRGQDVVATPGRSAPPVLTLGSASAEFFGSTGCNRTLGSFRREGPKLSFAQTVTTRLECPPDLTLDEEFVGALRDVARWRIIGRILELTDSQDAVLARFEAS